MYHYNWWSIFSETIVCNHYNYYWQPKGCLYYYCILSVSENIARILTTNYSDTHHREITVNTREDATEITIPWFNTNLIFLQCIIDASPSLDSPTRTISPPQFAECVVRVVMYCCNLPMFIFLDPCNLFCITFFVYASHDLLFYFSGCHRFTKT